ncbi:MAG: cysteine synthase family protein [Microgenomates group bacterium]
MIVFVDPISNLHGWAYSPQQELDGIEQLKRILISYPIPSLMKGVRMGSVIHISGQETLEELHMKLDGFTLSINQYGSAKIDRGDDIERIGNLPLITLHDPIIDNRYKSLGALDISYNPALSIKDIMARQMVDDAIQDGHIIKGKTIIAEATSGNTGAGIALMGAIYGNNVVLIVPNKVSEEKINRLIKFGAHVIVAPTKVSPTDPHSYYSIRDYIGTKDNVWVPQQYDNLSNTKAHYLYTGPQIWKETKGEVTTVIIPTGTSGTISGIGRYLKERNRNIKIIGVDTIGSILYLLKKGYALEDVQHLSHSYDIQGFGEDIYPKNLDLTVIDEYIRVSDISGLTMTRILPALGVFQGQSSGASYVALLEAIHRGLVTKKDSVVLMFPDSAIPYRNDVFNDEWMKDKKFSINY